MNCLRTKLTNRLSDNFFGFTVNQALNKLITADKNNLCNQFIGFYQKAISYLEQRFDFSNNSLFRHLRIFQLEEMFTVEQLFSVVSELGITSNIDGDALYNEYIIMKMAFMDENSSIAKVKDLDSISSTSTVSKVAVIFSLKYN